MDPVRTSACAITKCMECSRAESGAAKLFVCAQARTESPRCEPHCCFQRRLDIQPPACGKASLGQEIVFGRTRHTIFKTLRCAAQAPSRRSLQKEDTDSKVSESVASMSYALDPCAVNTAAQLAAIEDPSGRRGHCGFCVTRGTGCVRLRHWDICGCGDGKPRPVHRVGATW